MPQPADSDDDEVVQWAQEHFGQAELGDKRRTRRLVQVAARLGRGEGTSVARAMGAEPSAVEGAYRLVRNPEVRPEAIGEAGFAATARAARPHEVLVEIQD